MLNSLPKFSMQTLKDQAKKLGCGLYALQGTTASGKPTLLMWKPKAIKPYVRYSFRSEEEMKKYFKKAVSAHMDRMDAKEKYKQERKGTPEQQDSVKVGDIFVDSWGYDQTNKDFYQVIERKGRYVTVREIASKNVQTQSSMSEMCIGVKDKFIEDAPKMKKLLQFYCGQKAHIAIASYSSCGLWDGKPTFRSHWA